MGRINGRMGIAGLLGICALLSTSGAGAGGPPGETSSAKCDPGGTAECRLGDVLIVQLDANELKAVENGTGDNRLGSVGLYLDGRLVKNLDVQTDAQNPTALRFRLERKEANRAEWGLLFGNHLFHAHEVSVAVGRADRPNGLYEKGHVKLVALRPSPRTLVLALFTVACLLAALYCAFRTPMLRDAGTATSAAPSTWREHGTFSLAKVQMALWTVGVITAFLLIWTVTGDYDAPTASVLGLMGVGAATSLASLLVDQGKRDTRRELEAKKPIVEKQKNDTTAALVDRRRAEEDIGKIEIQLARTAPLPQAESDGLRDLITDGAGGVTLPRLQMTLWTFVLFVIFVSEVWGRLQMPAFSPALLALMGLSGSTYVGFKTTERPA